MAGEKEWEHISGTRGVMPPEALGRVGEDANGPQRLCSPSGRAESQANPYATLHAVYTDRILRRYTAGPHPSLWVPTVR